LQRKQREAAFSDSDRDSHEGFFGKENSKEKLKSTEEV
jgi:hypothetical protein